MGTLHKRMVEIRMSSTKRSGPWGISIRTKKKTIMRVVPRREGESLKGCLDRTKRAAIRLKEKYRHRKDIIIEIISRRKAFPPPEDYTPRRNLLWCPYCRKPRQFKRGQLIEVDNISFISQDRRCVVCQMSDNDFYVRTYNNLWPKIRA